MENLNSKSSEDIGDAIINRFANLSYSNQPAVTSVGVDVETKIIESSDPQTLSNCDMLFTPSSKCPKAFIKERVVLSPDDPSWVLRKMNFDYDQKVTKISAMKENPHSEEDLDSQATTSEGEFDSQTITSLDTVDTVSHSTYLAPYMAKNADKLVSETLSQDESDETSISSNSQLGDVTVISVTSDDEDGSAKNVAKHPPIPDENVLKDSSNAFIISNESQSISKHGINRSRSFTLECPSPLLMDALQKNLIGLEPNLDDNTLSDVTDVTDMASNTSKPRARVPVSRSLMFSAVEKKETVDEKVSKKEDTKSTTERKTANLKAYQRLEIKNDISMPVLDIRKLCNESGRYFEPVSLSSDNYSFSQLYQSSANQLSSIASSDLENSESEIPKERETEIIVEREETDHPASDSSSKEAEDETMGQFLKQKQESFKQFLDDFSLKDKDLSRTFSVPPKLAMDLEKVEEPMCPLSMLEAQEVRFQEEMNKIREELNVHSHSLQEIKFLKQKVQKQDQTILELKNQLKMQQQKQTDWMEYIFDIQTVKLERLLQQKMEDFKGQFLKEEDEEVSISTVSDNEFEDFDGPPEHTTQNIPLPMNYNSSNSSTSSVMTVVKATKSAINEDTSTIRQFFMSKQAPSLEIITPPRALDPDMKPKFDKISAIVKGFLTRCLMKTHKVQGIIKTIKDTMSTALQIHADLDVYPPKSRTILSQDVQLSKRLLNQLNSACHEFSNIFFGYTIKEQMALIAQSRELRLNPRPKPEFRKISITKRHPRTRSLTPQIRNNSSLSKYQRKKNEYSPTNLHSNRIKRTSNSASPRLLNRRVCRSSTGNVTLQPPKGVSILPSYLIETPKKEPKLFTFDNRSPSFLN